MQLNPAAFNRFLGGIGQHVSWRRSDACPCVSPHSGAADTACPLCRGKRRVWRDAVEGLIGISSMSSKRQFAQFGVFEAGDLLLTIPSDSPVYDIGQYDIIQLPGATQPFSAVLEKGRRDELLFTPHSIGRVWWIEGGNAVESGARDVSGKKIAWGTEAAPGAGVKYTVTGRWNPEYFVYLELPTERAHHGGAALPRRVVVRRFDLLGR